ncbi:MBL fold metallo-hydrolase [Weeksella virosa]|uniref:MBL fold metallo-hydrolase n=1 Tax=Weeksella virosa TaxID=1014 RepID=UPI002552F287|nr:MBL fold metallo-hydrolase [Weeksella virosa]MDK7374997.1 MBL fold metallo-hydrolase [Weeksella virosa]
MNSTTKLLKNKSFWLLIMIFHMQCIFSQVPFFERVYDETLSQASYVIADPDTKEAIVIDPKRDVDTYLTIAQKNNLKITQITETHIHADFLSGSRELQAATKAKLLLSNEGGKDWQYEFAHEPLKDGDVIKVGRYTLEVMHTPGHTPESLTFLLKGGKLQPIRAITGDFIFVGDVGRPDLLEKAAGQQGTQEEAAKQLFASIKRFSQLPDNTEIWPGHGAGSFCGKSLSNIPQSTLAEEKQTNEALKIKEEASFVRYILEGQPEPPAYFAVMKQLNKIQRPLLIQVPKHPFLTKEEVDRARQNNVLIVDTRKKENVQKGFIPGSVHFENGKMLSTFMGSLIDYQQQLLIVAKEEERDDITRKLMRIGMDNIYGFVSDVHQQSLPLLSSKIVDIDGFKKYLNRSDVQLIDVRTVGEYKAGHIQGLQNIPLNTIEQDLSKIDKNKPVVLHCQSGVRAAMAYSILRKNGFENIINYSGGINDWVEKKNELVQEK